MEKYLCMTAGAAIALAALIYLVKLLILRCGGTETSAEIIAVRESQKGTYVHTLRFDFNGKIVEKDDKTGYSQPMSKGDVRRIIYSKKDPARFEYKDALAKHMIIAAVLIVMSALIVIRFMFFVDTGEITLK